MHPLQAPQLHPLQVHLRLRLPQISNLSAHALTNRGLSTRFQCTNLHQTNLSQIARTLPTLATTKSLPLRQPTKCHPFKNLTTPTTTPSCMSATTTTTTCNTQRSRHRDLSTVSTKSEQLSTTLPSHGHTALTLTLHHNHSPSLHRLHLAAICNMPPLRCLNALPIHNEDKSHLLSNAQTQTFQAPNPTTASFTRPIYSHCELV
mmetsp:Transcript_20987/g.33511  ORF Transcript_20987/g.33511 Transcript_20987/m.33511 type:complete len:204 (-) Transcript_20987:174-785(-)